VPDWEEESPGYLVALDTLIWGEGEDRQSTTLYLVVEESDEEPDNEMPDDEESDDGLSSGWSWSVSISEEDSGFGESVLGSGFARELPQALKECAAAAEEIKEQEARA
jgi:hypothetical protein